MSTAEIVLLQRDAKVNWFQQVAERAKNALVLPDSVGVLMQKFRKFGLEHKDREVKVREASRLYPLFLAQYKAGIKNYEIGARSHGELFAGRLKHSMDPNQELIVRAQECLCVYSTQSKDSDGRHGDYVLISGDLNGNKVYKVIYDRWQAGDQIEYAAIEYDSESHTPKVVSVN